MVEELAQAQCLCRDHFLNILLCAGHKTKDFLSITTLNPPYHPRSNYWCLRFTDEETDSEFRQLLQIHMDLSDSKAHALNHSANFLHNESVSFTPRANLNCSFEGEGVFEHILMSWCGHHKPNTKVLTNILDQIPDVDQLARGMCKEFIHTQTEIAWVKN